MLQRFMLLPIFCMATFIALPSTGLAQKRKPVRAKAPKFDDKEFDGIFFSDVRTVLKGELPKSQQQLNALAGNAGTAPGESGTSSDSADPMAWHKLISPESLEDHVKSSKLRLGKIVTTPTAFAGGGFNSARREFSLQALLFAIIEIYPNDDVRFKKSAPVARELFARAAANSKVGSIQSFNEAKQRMADLGDMVNGSTLAGDAKSETDWSELMDRTPLMQLLEWGNDENLAKLVASEEQFKANKEQVRSFAELVAVLGKTSLQEEMPDADDEDYAAFVKTMIEHTQQVTLAVETDNADMARKAAAQIGQSCQACHDDYR
ncbi:MAG: hypothetical protein AAF394_17945 [Planctomycetota bacterium]